MSGLAKAFVVINLILALFFLGASATLFQTQEGWKKAAETVAGKLDSLETATKGALAKRDGEIGLLKGNNQSLSTENAVVKAEAQKLRNENGDLKNDIAQNESRLNVLENQISQKDAHIQDKDNVIASKEETIVQLTREKAEADERAKEAVAVAQRAQLDRQQLEETLGNTYTLLAQTQSELSDKVLTLEMVEQAGFDVNRLGVQATPKIQGVVVAVRDGIVVLSVGRDDNVKAGYEFTVYENDRFIGKVKVENVLGDMSGARVLFTEQGQTIRAGQQASTRLSG